MFDDDDENNNDERKKTANKSMYNNIKIWKPPILRKNMRKPLEFQRD